MSDSERAIIVDTYQLTHLPIQHAASLLERLSRSSEGSWRARNLQPIAKLFECFLETADLRLVQARLEGPSFRRIAGLFVGALYSSKFLSAPSKRRYTYARLFVDAVQDAWPNAPTLSTLCTTEDVRVLVEQFERLPLNALKVWRWRGWRVVNSTGRPYWLPLLPAADCLGMPFVDKLHTLVADYYAPRRAHYLPGLREFALFLRDSAASIELLRSPGFMKEFWQLFWEFYLNERSSRDSNATLLDNWANWKHFVVFSLIPGGLVAPLIEEEIAGPDGTSRIAADGDQGGGNEPPERLLTPVPDSATDAEAWRLLLVAVPASLDRVRTWATKQADDLYARCSRRHRLAKTGVARPTGLSTGRNGHGHLLDGSNPEYLQNAAATFEKYGYPKGDTLKALLRHPIQRTAYELGLPTAKSLLAHATLIALSDAKITTSFLDELELFDVNGKLVGFSEYRGIHYLTGYKRRRGRKLAQLRIKLDAETAKRVAEVIEITAPARAHLRRTGAKHWTRLFLETGRGFATPKAVNFSKSAHYAKLDDALAIEFAGACSISLDEARELAERFTIRNVRVTLGIKHFIDTHSETEAAHALGHHALHDDLLSRYIPPALVSFYRERWIRAFQHSVLIYCATDDEQAMRATGFQSKEELHSFMESSGYAELEKIFSSNNRPQVSSPPKTTVKTEQACEDGEDGAFILNANVSNFVALLTIRSGAEDSHLPEGERKFWKSFANHMLNQVELRQRHDPRLADLLTEATSIVNSPSAH